MSIAERYLEDEMMAQQPLLVIEKLADKIADEYPTDCEEVKALLRKQKSVLISMIYQARQMSGNGWDKVLLSRQELRLAEAEFEKAKQRYRNDCLIALRNRRF